MIRLIMETKPRGRWEQHRQFKVKSAVLIKQKTHDQYESDLIVQYTSFNKNSSYSSYNSYGFESQYEKETHRLLIEIGGEVYGHDDLIKNVDKYNALLENESIKEAIDRL